MKNKVIVISQSINQPRVVNRINALSQQYKNVEVITFNRSIYDVGNYENIFGSNISIRIVAKIEDGKYLKRLFTALKMMTILLSKIFIKQDVYCFGLDSRIYTSILIFNDKYYEISDIVWLYYKDFNKMIWSNLAFYLAKKSKKIIFTSEGFYRKHYNFISEQKVVIEENKFKTYGKVNPILNLSKDRISIGYIGAFRYFNIIKDIIKVVSENPNIDLNFYGDGPIEIKDYIIEKQCQFKNIKFHGSFKNPDDLTHIYKVCNLNFVCYDNKLANELVAMPNKYYESGFFNIPIVCSTKTFLSEKVLQNNMGWAINPNYEDLKLFFDSLSMEEIIEKHEKIQKLDKKLFVK